MRFKPTPSRCWLEMVRYLASKSQRCSEGSINSTCAKNGSECNDEPTRQVSEGSIRKFHP